MKELNDDWWVVDGESRIANEFWVAPDGSVCRYHMAPEDTYESVCAIVSLHRVIAERLFPDIPDADDYMHRMGYILVQLNSHYRWPSCVGSPTRLRSIPCGILGMISMMGVVLVFMV